MIISIMEVRCITDPEMKENAYVLIEGDDCLLIDPGSDDDFVMRDIHKMLSGKRLKAIVYTHNHFDHLRGGRHFDVDQYMSEDDINELPLQTARAKSFWGVEFKEPRELTPLNEEMDIGRFHFRTIPTPGHTTGSVCLFFEKENVLFTGDTLFKRTYGRTDLGGDDSQMRSSLKKLAKLPPKTLIYPGHGDYSTIEDEIDWIEAIP